MMKFVTIVAAFTACAIVTLGVIGGRPAVGTAAGVEIRSRPISPFDMMKDARGLPAETVDNVV